MNKDECVMAKRMLKQLTFAGYMFVDGTTTQFPLISVVINMEMQNPITHRVTLDAGKTNVKSTSPNASGFQDNSYSARAMLF